MSIIYHPKQVVPRRDQLKVAHATAHQLGYITRLSDSRRARYEDRLEQIIDKRSLKGATRHERNAVVKALEAELQAQRGLTYAADDFSDESCLELLS